MGVCLVDLTVEENFRGYSVSQISLTDTVIKNQLKIFTPSSKKSPISYDWGFELYYSSSAASESDSDPAPDSLSVLDPEPEPSAPGSSDAGSSGSDVSLPPASESDPDPAPDSLLSGSATSASSGNSLSGTSAWASISPSSLYSQLHVPFDELSSELLPEELSLSEFESLLLLLLLFQNPPPATANSSPLICSTLSGCSKSWPLYVLMYCIISLKNHCGVMCSSVPIKSLSSE